MPGSETGAKPLAILVGAVVFFIGALGLRLIGLGEWSFAGDEVATLHEEQVLFHGAPADKSSQAYRLPHAIPLGYAAIHLGHEAFGWNEFGARVVPAAAGALTVGLTYGMLAPAVGVPAATATALMLALWPHHVYRGQEARFYMVAAAFASIAFLLGAWGVRSQNLVYLLGAGVAIACAVLSHTVLASMYVVIFFAVWLGRRIDGRSLQRGASFVILGSLLLGILILGLYVRPFLSGWNSGESWGYSTVHSLLASVAMVGWGIGLYAAVGAVSVLVEGGGQRWYWLLGAAAWAGATLVLPLIVSYHPGYVFPLALPVFVLAGLGVESLFRLLREKSAGAAWTSMLILCLASLPSLASHFLDGSRWPMRDAAHFVAAHAKPGDGVAGFSMGTFRYYGADCCDKLIPLPLDATEKLEQLARQQERTWIVLESSRGGLNAGTQDWLYTCTRHAQNFSSRRFDEASYDVDVYLLDPTSTSCGSERP